MSLYESSYSPNRLETDLLNATYTPKTYGFTSVSEPASTKYSMIWYFTGVTSTPHNYSSGVITDAALVDLLAAQWQTTWVGFGIDPDCHFGDSGLRLTVNTESIEPPTVPEPASLLLFGTGLVGLRAWRKRRQ